MPDFLLELRSEEIPARMQAGARAELEKLFRREMDAAGVTVGDLTVWSTPRRLALIARDLPDESLARIEETRGPKLTAPDQAKEGFARSRGRRIADLEVRDEYLWDVVEHPGLSTIGLLAAAIPAIVRDFAWPKSMRWGAASLSTESPRWVRPLSGIVALLGEDLVECEAGGVTSGYATMGHRFHHSGEITIGSASDYAEKLRACHVIVDHEERQDMIRAGAAKVAAAAGLTLVADEGLVIENAGLTEWPVPLLGRFDEAFLDVPPEVIQLTARVNQKYFVCTSPLPLAGGAGGGPVNGGGSAPTPNPSRKREGDRLANAFVCTANITAADGGAAIVDGNRKVLAARLSDARFFWEQDRKTPLAEHAKKLERITFHEKLGTVADKVERVAKLARWLVEEGIVAPTRHSREGGNPSTDDSTYNAGQLDPRLRGGDEPLYSKEELADLAEQAARLCKADLVTEMVGEFPELQGLMGGYYARAEGLPDEVADAIRDHYKPVGQGDDVPTAPVTVAVSLADKLDTLVSFFAIDEKPTGSKDPFALRRAALAVIRLLQANTLRMNLSSVRAELVEAPSFSSDTAPERKDGPSTGSGRTGFGDDLLDFFADRLKVQQREAGVRHDLIDAVFALGEEDDLVRLLARVHALQAFMGSEDGANLLAGYKRAANILKKEGVPAPLPLAGGAGGGPVDGGGSAPTSDPSRKREGNFALSYTPEPAEKALIDALDAAEPQAGAAVEAEDFAGAMAALASLRGPIDRFFEEVTVNADEENKRESRLALLARFRAAVHKVADFSRIEG